MVLKVIDYLKKVVPNREKALAYVRSFDYEEYKRELTAALGNSALGMIENERRKGKYDPQKHAARLEVILSHYDEIMEIVHRMPSYNSVYETLKSAGLPLTPEELGFSKKEIREAFIMAKDIRDKYVVSRLLWDLGLLEEAADELFPCE